MLTKIKFLLEKNKIMKAIALFIYKNTYIKYWKYKENKNFIKHGKEVLEQVDKVFNEIGVTYWLDFGTLLGAYRNKDFLQHDEDIDIGMWLEDYDRKHQLIFEKYGFKKIKEFLIDDGKYGREESYKYLNVQVDIFYFTKLDSSSAYYHDFIPLENKSIDLTIEELGGLIPREITLTIEKIDYIEFKGRKYPAPFPIEKHLADRYGNDFMIENKNWKLGKEKFPNIKILKDKIGVLKKYE